MATSEEVEGILNAVRSAAESGSNADEIHAIRRDMIGVGGGKLGYDTRRSIEVQLLKFLRDNSSLLPMFFLPE